MNDYQRIEELKSALGLNSSELARSLGLSSPQVFYDIKKGKCGISKDLASKIKEKYLNINTAYLLTGEGTILLDGSVMQIGNNNISGDDNQIGGSTSALELALSEISEQRKLAAKSQELLAESQAQVSRLITIIENLNK